MKTASKFNSPEPAPTGKTTARNSIGIWSRLLKVLSVLLALTVADAKAAITYDAASSGSAGGGATSVAWSHTVGSGVNRMLVVGVTTESNPDAVVTGVTFGAQTFTQVPGSRAVQSSPFNVTEFWYLPAPNVGTATITVTFGSAISSGNGTACGAVSLFGAVQAGPEAVAIANAAGSGSSYSLGITTLTNGAWLVDVVNNGTASATFTPTAAGMVERWDLLGAGTMGGACATREVTAAGAVTDTWTTNGVSRKAQSIVAFAPAPAPPNVSITSPVNAATVGANYTIAATAWDEGSITNVEFFEDGISVDIDITAPYSVSRTGAAPGAHVLTAVATDNNSNTTTSAAVNITVGNLPVTLLSQNFDTDPPNWATTGTWASTPFAFDTSIAGSRYWALSNTFGLTVNPGISGNDGTYLATQNIDGGTVTFSSTSPAHLDFAVPAGGYNNLKLSIALAGLSSAEDVNFIRAKTDNDGDGIYETLVFEFKGATNSAYTSASPSGTLTAAFQTFSNIALPSPTAGNTVLHLRIESFNDTDSQNEATGIDSIVIAGTPFSGPSATITSPANGATVGAAFLIEANAVTTSGTINSVTFYDGATPLPNGTDTTSPYTYAWIGAPLGAHALTAVAQDSNSLSATSPVVNVTVVAGAGTLTRGPYLQMAGSTQMTIRWRNSLQNLGRVNYGTSAGTLNQTVDESIAPAPAPASGFDHVVTLTGLAPNTTYFYSIGSGSDTLASGADYTFHTSPVPGTATNTRIWVVGDCGRGTSFQTDVRDAYYAWTGARTPDFCLQLGDNAYDSGTDAEYGTKFFGIYPTMFRKMPQWSTLGNHDANNGSTSPTANFPYFDMFTFPTAAECGGVASGTERYYSFDYGNIHVINLDSQTSSRAVDNPATPGTNEDGPMAAWLRADLASTTKTWIIVMFHHPPYSKGSHNSDTETQLIEMRRDFGPILEAGGVDLVLSGHSHSYERSKFIDGFYNKTTEPVDGVFKNSGDGRPAGGGAYIKPLTGPRDHFGAVYSVPGSAGAVSGGSLNHPVMYVSYNTGGTLNLDINGNRLDATYVEKGPTTGTYTTPDTFTIIKQGAADSDNDGIPDAYEIAHGLNRFDPADAPLDSDSDGVSNIAEFIFDTESNLSDSYAFSTSYDLLNGTNTITFETITGRTYRILYSNDLLSWLPASASVAGTGATMMWVDNGTGTGSPPSAVTKRFYRVEVTVVP